MLARAGQLVAAGRPAASWLSWPSAGWPPIGSFSAEKLRVIGMIGEVGQRVSVGSNYVLQHMVELRSSGVTELLVRQFQGCFVSLSKNKYASNVGEKCLIESQPYISTMIVLELVGSSNPSSLLVDPYQGGLRACAGGATAQGPIFRGP
ncbi:hypothetical protein R6Q59_029163 [Mikania micrantha]